MLKQYSILFIIISLTNNSFSQENNIMFSSDRLILGVSKERTASVSSGDIDNDGDQDIIIANGRHWPGQNKIFINDGRGIFTIEKNLGAQRSTTYAAELGDFDLDGDLDFIVNCDDYAVWYQDVIPENGFQKIIQNVIKNDQKS